MLWNIGGVNLHKVTLTTKHQNTTIIQSLTRRETMRIKISSYEAYFILNIKEGNLIKKCTLFTVYICNVQNTLIYMYVLSINRPSY